MQQWLFESGITISSRIMRSFDAFREKEKETENRQPQAEKKKTGEPPQEEIELLECLQSLKQHCSSSIK